MTRDPVCGAELDEHAAMPAGLVSHYFDRSFCFCSPKCKKRFDNQPGAFATRFTAWHEWDVPDQLWNDNWHLLVAK